MRKSYYTILLLSIFSSTLFYGFSTGITGVTLKNGNGCECHGAAAAGVNVVISGPAQLAPSQTGTYTVTISGGPLVRGGTNIAASAGTLAATGSDLRLASGELTHVQPKAVSGGNVSFTFTYTAPATEGVQTLFANGNSVNFNGNNSGDQWNFAPNFAVNVTSVTSVNDENPKMSFRLNQNYPNPFNPSTTIAFSIPSSGNVKLSVYDVTGKKIANLLDANMEEGDHQVTFDLSSKNLSAGIYFYELNFAERSSGEVFSSIKKMVYLK